MTGFFGVMNYYFTMTGEAEYMKKINPNNIEIDLLKKQYSYSFTNSYVILLKNILR